MLSPSQLQTRTFLLALAWCIAIASASGAEVVRVMAANTTSGNFQSYDPAEGRRIFKGLDPDIVLIQEFNYGDDSPSDIRDLVDLAFGIEFYYFREDGNEQIRTGLSAVTRSSNQANGRTPKQPTGTSLGRGLTSPAINISGR